MWALLVLAGLLLLISSFAVWVNRVALNTQAFTGTTSDLLADDAIRSAVATRAVDELYSSVDVQKEIKDQLPENLQSVSGLVSAGVRQASYEVLDRALQQPALQKSFAVAVEQSHETLVQVLEGGGTRASTEGGVVTLNLRDIVLEAADRIGIGSQVADKLPADAGQIVILRSDQLHTAQSTFRILKTLAWILPLLTIIVFGVAVWIARDRRRAIRGFGITAIVVGVLGLVAARVGGGYIVGSLVKDRDTRVAAQNAWVIVTELMRTSYHWMIILGVLVVVGAFFAGPGRRALEMRGWLAPVLRERVWAYGALAVIALLLVTLSPTLDFVRFLWILMVLVLCAFWIETMRRRTLHEYPDATTPAFIGDARARLSSWWTEGRASIAGSRAPAPAAAPAPAPAAAQATDLQARLAGLADLHTRGELTDEEFTAAKARVLAGD
jgi:hypothetical protein